LEGHSDADAALHSAIDAILSAAHLGNIGKLFPSSDKSYENIRSTILLKRVAELIENRGYALINLSTVIIAQQPRLSGYLEKMEHEIAEILHLGSGDVSISAKTNDEMGFIGKAEGVAAYSVCLVRKL